METFEPSRLTVAREIRQMTKKGLASAVDVSAPAITGFENGASSPSDKTALQIAMVLGFPRRFFNGLEIDTIDEVCVSFRSRRSMSSSVRNATLASGRIAYTQISPGLRNRFEFPALDFPDLSRESPSNAAAFLRSHWKLGQGPIKNMVHLLESKGCEIYWINIDSPSVDAVSFWKDSQPYIIFSQIKEAGERGRFDAAHELGHLILHRGIKVDDEGSNRQSESEADAFASAFLLPAEQFRAEAPRLPILDHFLPLKARWGVSIQAMIRRCKDLGIFSPWQYESACKSISFLGFRTREPGQMPREQSILHEKALAALAAKGVSPRDLATSMDLSLADLTDLVPMAGIVEREMNRLQRPTKSKLGDELQLKHLRLVG